MIEWLDRFLNRIIFLLIGVAGLIAMFQAMSSPRPPPIRELGFDGSALMSVMNPSCYRVEETLAFVRACADVPEGEAGVACPLEAPEWVRFRPETSTMADLLVEQLEARQASDECQALARDPFEGLTAEERNMSWSELQQRRLELQAEIEAAEETADANAASQQDE